MRPVNVGIIGCGHIAREVHLSVLCALPNVRVMALAEPDPQALKAAHKFVPQATTFSQADGLLAVPTIEAVILCLPNALHASTAIAAFEAGKSVYLEKPIALSSSEAQEVVAAWRRANTVGALGFNYRFNPLLCELRQALRDQRIGRLVAVRSAFCAPLREMPPWKQTRASGGGVLLDLASHHLDLLRFLVGQEVVQAWANLRSVNFEADTAAIELQLEDGTPIQGLFSQSAAEQDVWEFEGEAGRLRVDRYAMSQVEVTRPGEMGLSARLKRTTQSLSPRHVSRRVRHTLNKQKSPLHEPSYRIALEHFVRAIQEDESDLCPTPLDGLRNMEIIAALEAAARSGSWVAVHHS